MLEPPGARVRNVQDHLPKPKRLQAEAHRLREMAEAETQAACESLRDQ